MEVTKSNFYQLIPEIKAAIDKCDFISIDCELTGLNTGNDINALDTQKQYYDKIRKNSRDFLIIQYGLCMFRYDTDSKTYKQTTYNFYIFPTCRNRHVPDHRFLCQSSCIVFLTSVGFDFNKLFKEGIPYLNREEEYKYKDTLSDIQKKRANQIHSNFSPETKNKIISMTIEEKAFVDNVFKEIEEFIVSDSEECVLPKCNAYLRRLVYQNAQKTLQNKARLETRVSDNKDRILVVTRLKNKSVREEENKKKSEKEEEELEKSVGFSIIIKMIVESKKLVIGHNMCLDLLHTINQFLTSLPCDYEEFKNLANCFFPKVLDTKYMSSVAPFKNLIDSNILANLLSTLQKEPFRIPDIEIEENRHGYLLDSTKEHEAGYDAYITGVCFLTMWNYLHDAEESHNPDVFLLKPYINKLFLMRLQDSPFINLGGKDSIPSRDHVVYLSFPSSWKLNDIVQLFSPFGNIYVSWIDDYSAFVSLQKKDQISVALSTLSQSDTYTIMTYAQRQIEITRQNNASTSSTPCSSSRNKRSADNNHAAMKIRKMNLGEVLKRKSNNESSIDEVCNSPGKLSTPQNILTEKTKLQTFAEVTWD